VSGDYTGQYIAHSPVLVTGATVRWRPVRGRPWKTSGYTDRATGTNPVRYMSVDAAT
jgi:hypothetical protein